MKRLRTIRMVGILVAWVAGLPNGSHAAWPSDPTVNLPIAIIPYSREFPQIIPDGAGGAILTWDDGREASVATDIYAQRVSGAGDILWDVNGISVTNAPSGQYRPQIVSDGEFGAIIAWTDWRKGTESDVYAQRVDPFGRLLWDLSGVPICTAANDQAWVHMASDGAGGALITWEDLRADTSDIYAQRIDGSGNILWGADGVAVCAASRDQWLPQIISDGVGGAFLAWEDQRSWTSAQDVYAQRIRANGTPAWAPDGVGICVMDYYQWGPELVTDGEGGAIVVWEDDRFANGGDIYAQRIDSTGAVLWQVNGVGVCTAVQEQHRPRILADGSSGAFICWPDYRDDSSIYANRIDGAGDILWAANGIPICRAAGTSDWPEIISDRKGGVITAWEDTRNVAFRQDIYAQRVDGAGNVVWTLDGVPVTTAVDRQVHLSAAPDGRSGAIITWEDWRDGGLIAQRYRIYAQRVDSLGGLTVPTGIETPLDPHSSFQFLFTAPGPPSGGVEFRFELSRTADLGLEIFDVVGRRVFTTVLRNQSEGSSRYVFDGRNDEGRALPSGVYFARAVAGGSERTLKLVIVR